MEMHIQTTAYFYSQFNAFCIIIMLVLLSTTLIDVDRNSYRYCQINTIVAILIYCVMDSLWMLVYENVLPRTQLTRTISNVLLYCSMDAGAFSVFYLLEENLKKFAPASKWNKKWTLIALWLLMLVPLTTPWTKLLFTIHEDGSFTKGFFYMPFIIIVYGSLISTELKTIFLWLTAENGLYRSQYVSIICSVIPIIVGGAVHLYDYTIPSITAGITVSILQFHIMQIREQVSLDTLTGINNRKQGERFFFRQISIINQQDTASENSLYLFIADLNKFKSINDTFGHAEGDHALTITAEALRDVCTIYSDRCMICRFGGDEFVIGGLFENDARADKFCDVLKLNLAKKCAEKKLPYDITLSIGYERYRKELKTLKNLLSAADQKMYQQKQGLQYWI